MVLELTNEEVIEEKQLPFYFFHMIDCMSLNNKDHVPITPAFLSAQHSLGTWLAFS